jgi:hypothetical protein
MRLRIVMVAAIIPAAIMLAGSLSGCDGKAAGPASPAPTSGLPPLATTAPPSTAPPSTAAASSTTSTAGLVDELSDSVEYARNLGGISHQGEILYFVVGAVVQSEVEAQTLLREAIPFFGDMQSYFIVQRSDSFEGFEPARWVIVEPYAESPSAENIEFGRRAFPGAYVTSAKVLTSDPIPVYEDRLGL